MGRGASILPLSWELPKPCLAPIETCPPRGNLPGRSESMKSSGLSVAIALRPEGLPPHRATSACLIQVASVNSALILSDFPDKVGRRIAPSRGRLLRLLAFRCVSTNSVDYVVSVGGAGA